MKNKSLKTEQFFKWIDDECFRNELSDIIKSIKSSRKENQYEISKTTGIPLTKVKQIEKGTCVDFNAIINYVNYLSVKRISFLY